MLRNRRLEAPELRPLSEVPALVVGDSRQDVRGWLVIGQQGKPLGPVLDLLVDIDRLKVEFLIVATNPTDGARAEVVIPIGGLACHDERRQLVAGSGMRPIQVQYRSTVALSVWAALAALIAFVLAWTAGWIAT